MSLRYGTPDNINSQYYISSGDIRHEGGTLIVPWALMMNLKWYDDLNNVCKALRVKALLNREDK